MFRTSVSIGRRRLAAGVSPVPAPFAACRAASSSGNGAEGEVPPEQQMAPGPYRKVGNILVVLCVDHPFKYGWEINRALRFIKLEHKGEVRVLADTPANREWLFRVRHLVQVDMMSTDEAKDMLGVPRGVTFTDLKKQIPRNFGPGLVQDFDITASFVDFAEVRRARLRDIMQRDAVELRLLAKKKLALAQQQQTGTETPQQSNA